MMKLVKRLQSATDRADVTAVTCVAVDTHVPDAPDLVDATRVTDETNETGVMDVTDKHAESDEMDVRAHEHLCCESELIHRRVYQKNNRVGIGKAIRCFRPIVWSVPDRKYYRYYGR